MRHSRTLPPPFEVTRRAVELRRADASLSLPQSVQKAKDQLAGQCQCSRDCEMPCWQRVGIAPPCKSCGCAR